MAGRRRLCCSSVLLLVLASQVLLVTRLRSHRVLMDRATGYIGEVRDGLRHLVSSPGSAPGDDSAPGSARNDDSAPASARNDDSAPGSARNDAPAPDSAPGDLRAPETAPDDAPATGSAQSDAPAPGSAQSDAQAPDSAPGDASVPVSTQYVAAAPDSAPAAAVGHSPGGVTGAPSGGVTLSERPPHLIIILSSSARSGSSLLGEILSTSPNTAYFFEPFYYHVKNNISVARMPAAEVQRTLRQLLTCRLDKMDIFRKATYRRFIWRSDKSRVMPSTSVLMRRCAASTSRVVKLVRPRLSQLMSLLQDAELGPHIRLVHLVRDPRGTLNSKLHANNVWRQVADNLEGYCNGVRADLAAARELDDPRYQRVHYELLALRPEHVAVELYRSMQLPQPVMLHAYFQRHMNSSSPPPPPPPPPAPAPAMNGRRAGWRGPPAPVQRRPELPQRRVAAGRVKRALPPANRQPSGLGKKEQQRQQQRLQRLQQQKQQKEQQQRVMAQRARQSRLRKQITNYFSTYRGPGFDPYHWRKELKPEVLQKVEDQCADVIDELETEVAAALEQTGSGQSAASDSPTGHRR